MDRPQKLPGLSTRQTEVALGVYAGKKNKAIARELGLSRMTVANYLSQMYQKLEAGRQELGSNIDPRVILVRFVAEHRNGTSTPHPRPD